MYYVKAAPSVVDSSLPGDQDVELSVSSPALRLPACWYASCHDDDELNL